MTTKHFEEEVKNHDKPDNKRNDGHCDNITQTRITPPPQPKFKVRRNEYEKQTN